MTGTTPGSCGAIAGTHAQASGGRRWCLFWWQVAKLRGAQPCLVSKMPCGSHSLFSEPHSSSEDCGPQRLPKFTTHWASTVFSSICPKCAVDKLFEGFL